MLEKRPGCKLVRFEYSLIVGFGRQTLACEGFWNLKFLNEIDDAAPPIRVISENAKELQKERKGQAKSSLRPHAVQRNDLTVLGRNSPAE